MIKLGKYVVLCAMLFVALRCVQAEPIWSARADWPTYHGNRSLSGVARCTVPDKPVRRWRFRANGSIDRAPTIGKYIYFTTDDGIVYAVDLDGKERWSTVARPKDGVREQEYFTGATVLIKDKVVIGGKSGTVYAFDGATGLQAWQYKAGTNVLNSVAACTVSAKQEAALAITWPEGDLHCIDVDSGKKIWVARGAAPSAGSPSVTGAKIVFGDCDCTVQIVSTRNGDKLSAIELSEPKGNDGRTHSREMAGGAAIDVNYGVFVTRTGEVFAINLNTQDILWKNADSDARHNDPFPTPALTRDSVILANLDGIAYSMDRKSGQTDWSFKIDDLHLSSPVVAGDKVIVSGESTIYMLSVKTGETLWSYVLGEKLTEPSVAHGLIVVGTVGGRLVAFGEKK